MYLAFSSKGSCYQFASGLFGRLTNKTYLQEKESHASASGIPARRRPGMSAHDLFVRMGISQRLVDDFIRPTLLVPRAPFQTLGLLPCALWGHGALPFSCPPVSERQSPCECVGLLPGGALSPDLKCGRAGLAASLPALRQPRTPFRQVGLFKPPEELSAAVAKTLNKP